ncbi:MAG TPA: hypothetical protein VEV17_23175 [Bryobacteraceae bacterium]|nr:hypothetical protein [Bryobacteraceae bacterium]
MRLCIARFFVAVSIPLVATFSLVAPSAYAIPAFSRQYQTSCSTCHVDFPKLNDFGKAFKDAGFKFPKDDETLLKVPHVLLGAPAQKEVWPNSIWPGSIPGLPPIGLRMNTFFQVTSGSRDRFNPLAPNNAVPQFIPATDFQTGFFSIFTAGNFGSDIAFWVDDDISVGGSNAAGGLGDGYLKLVNIGRVFHLPTDALHFRAGQFELDLPFTQARGINLSPYDIYSQSNIGAINALTGQQNVANQFTFAGAARGLELSGGHMYGGYHYSVAVIDQNTSGINQPANTSPFVPSATGGSSGGVGFASDTSAKALYTRFSYRFNLERDEANRKEIQAAGPTGPRDHTYLNLGGFYLRGNSRQAFIGAAANGTDTTSLTVHEPYYRAGGDFSFNYRKLNVYGLYMWARDNNLLPVDADGNVILLPFSDASPLPVRFVSSVPAKFSGGFVQADYLALPWTMLIMRWDGVNSSADRINGFTLASGTPYFAPLRSTRTRFTPGVQFLIHPNIKADFEYQFRPQQSVDVATSATNLQAAQNAFRVQTALFGLEFVY